MTLTEKKSNKIKKKPDKRKKTFRLEIIYKNKKRTGF